MTLKRSSYFGCDQWFWWLSQSNQKRLKITVYLSFEYKKHLNTKLFEVQISDGLIFKLSSVCFGLCSRPTIKKLDQNIRKQDGIYLSFICFYLFVDWLRSEQALFVSFFSSSRINDRILQKRQKRSHSLQEVFATGKNLKWWANQVYNANLKSISIAFSVLHLICFTFGN